jgi:hypothetical protein
MKITVLQVYRIVFSTGINVPQTRWYIPTKLHGHISQKTAIFYTANFNFVQNMGYSQATWIKMKFCLQLSMMNHILNLVEMY